MRRKPKSTTLGIAISEAEDIVGELAEEMQNWQDGIEEHFSHTSKFERVKEAAEKLEQIQGDIQAVDLPNHVNMRPILVPRLPKSHSRASRAAHAAALLEAVADDLESVGEEAAQDEGERLADTRPLLKGARLRVYEKVTAGRQAQDGVVRHSNLTAAERKEASWLAERGLIGAKLGSSKKPLAYYFHDQFLVIVRSQEVRTVAYRVIAADEAAARSVIAARRARALDASSTDTYSVSMWGQGYVPMDADTIEEIRRSIDEQVEALGDVDFPGMYG